MWSGRKAESLMSWFGIVPGFACGFNVLGENSLLVCISKAGIDWCSVIPYTCKRVLLEGVLHHWASLWRRDHSHSTSLPKEGIPVPQAQPVFSNFCGFVLSVQSRGGFTRKKQKCACLTFATVKAAGEERRLLLWCRCPLWPWELLRSLAVQEKGGGQEECEGEGGIFSQPLTDPKDAPVWCRNWSKHWQRVDLLFCIDLNSFWVA